MSTQRALVFALSLVLAAACGDGRDDRRAFGSGAPRPSITIEHDLLDPVIGDGHAPVEIVVFGNPHCRACDVALDRVLAIQAARPSDVRVVYKWVGDGEDADDVVPAIGLYAAATLGCFDEFHQAQARTRPRTQAELELTAATAGCGGESFRAATQAPELRAAVVASAAQGRALGIRTTPLIVINGRLIAGNPPAHALATVINAAKNPRRVP